MKRSKHPLKDRYLVVNGVPTIRPVDSQGRPMLTQEERVKIIDEHAKIIEPLLAARRQDRSYDK